MIAIPNINKPKSCSKCQRWDTCSVLYDYFDGSVFEYSYEDILDSELDEKCHSDCPLIEIDQEDENAVLFLLRMRKAMREGKSWREFLDEERRVDERKKITIERNICPKPECGDEFPIPKEGWKGESDEKMLL